jgi:hypothetical protein
MHDKLELSQRVLEGLATENYELIIANGSKLSIMTQEENWRAFKNPDYDEQSLLFRGQVKALVKGAKDKNLDAATIAYVRMTLSCVDCHKFVRGKAAASNVRNPRSKSAATSVDPKPARDGESSPKTERSQMTLRAMLFHEQTENNLQPDDPRLPAPSLNALAARAVLERKL